MERRRIFNCAWTVKFQFMFAKVIIFKLDYVSRCVPLQNQDNPTQLDIEHYIWM